MHQPLSTDPNDFCFIDTETRSSVNVKDGGAYQHNANGRVIICTYAIGDADVQEWVLEDWTPGRKLDWRNAPRDLAEFLARVEAGSAWFVAWNAAFDRLSLSRGMLNKTMRVEWFIDAMAQAVKSHLPPDLMGACLAARVAVKKQASGKALIKLFCDEAGDATPQSHPEEWMQFRSYAHDDIPSMREIFWGTMPLSRKEWEEYWANERINDRGMPVDVPFVKAAAELAEFSAERANEQVFQITKGHIDSVNKTAAILAWVQHKLRMLPEVNRILLREVVEEPMPEGEDVRRVEKHSLDRGRVEELIAYLERVDTEQGLTDDEHDALQLLEVRLYGASATPKKFGKMVPMIDDGRIKGQYVFNGASATGRFSSRGLQLHNLTRQTVGSKDDELDAIEMVTNKGVDAYEPLQKRFGPVGKTLSRLIRPAFCAPEGHTFVWCDWSAIEARVLPWLSGSPSSEEYLNIFRTNDKDPSLPDIYKVQAGKLLNKDPKDVTKHERQSHGKVPCIAEGQLVLTDHGEVPIERVTVDMKVWDGLSFVSHQGLVFKGVKDVWEYQGVVATADHIVWTEEAGQLRLIDAARRGYNLVQSGAGRTPVWVGDSVDGGAPIHETKTSRSVCADSMCGVRVRAVAELEFPVVREDKRMPILLTATSCAEMVESTHDGGEESLHQPERPKMGALRRERGHVRLPIGLGCVSLGAREHRLGQNKGTGPHRQLERVCAGEFEVGIAAAERGKPEEQRYTGRLDIHTGGMAIRVSDSASETFSGRKNTRGDTLRCASRSGKSTQGLATYRGKARVYDLVNAGPRHRFTVAGKLVHNCLSLGFAGGKGALFNMARIYGASFTEEEAEAAVRGWRDSNPWAKRFWSEVWDAAQFCMENPGHSRAAGRAMYVYDNDYMGGTLFAVLPCGRALLYPRIRWENRETKDRATGAVVEKMQLTYRRGRGRAVLWVGVLVENLVQAFAGSLLRHALWRLDKEMPEAVIAHTHDEIICMCKDEDAVSVRARLEALMKEPPEWAEGLPLSAESVVCPYYSKTVD